METLKPIGDVVLIEKDNATETESGIALMEAYKDPAGCDSGRIVGFNWQYVNDRGVTMYAEKCLGVSVRVLFLRKHGIAVKGSKTLVAVRQEHLLAVFEE